ncbi:hypothetical protein Hanom_Chr04g00365111 [Helianthus anomalus]
MSVRYRYGTVSVLYRILRVGIVIILIPYRTVPIPKTPKSGYRSGYRSGSVWDRYGIGTGSVWDRYSVAYAQHFCGWILLCAV